MIFLQHFKFLNLWQKSTIMKIINLMMWEYLMDLKKWQQKCHLELIVTLMSLKIRLKILLGMRKRIWLQSNKFSKGEIKFILSIWGREALPSPLTPWRFKVFASNIKVQTFRFSLLSLLKIRSKTTKTLWHCRRHFGHL